jgi:hypothetical protein
MRAIAHARNRATNVLPHRLAALYAAILHAAPNAVVVVTGYPHLFNGHDCNDVTFFTRREMQGLNAAADLLDHTIAAAARRAAFAYLDPRAAFTGHAICDSDPWINDLTIPVDESFHPNIKGQSSYADLVLGHL